MLRKSWKYIAIILSVFAISYIAYMERYFHNHFQALPKIRPKETLVLISYADDAGGRDANYINQYELEKSAIFNGFRTIFSYTRSDLPKAFIEENAEILNAPRGAGYWLWKPYIILDAMKKTPDGAYIFYIDSSSIIKNIDGLLELVKKHGRIFIDVGEAGDTGKWTKRETFINLDCDTDECHNAVMVQAGYIMMVNNDNNKSFIKNWLSHSKNKTSITDIPNEKGENLPRFKDHRHDQSILSILNFKNKDKSYVMNYSDESQYIYNARRRNLIKACGKYLTSPDREINKSDNKLNGRIIKFCERLFI